jgi:peptidoglycan/xylan/chitin deacetylase (PgdA/CDA1 family)
MPDPFDELVRELDLWADAGRVASFWWRDDDAVAPAPELTRLLDLGWRFGIETGVAVVPAAARAALPDAIASYAGAVILQHGYAHANHARPGDPAVECGGARSLAPILDELAAGRERLSALFGTRFLEVLAAPWNRVETRVVARLPSLGFRGVSAYGPRRAMRGAEGIRVANAHVDPINWRERRFAGVQKALSGVVGELRSRRLEAADPEEPVGLLTHHRDHDPALWDFLERFFAVTQQHDSARWLGVAEAFADDRAAGVAQ